MSYQIGSLDIGVAFAGDVSGLQQATSGAGSAVDGFSKKATTSLKDVQNESKRTEDSMARLANGIKGAFIGGSVAVGLIKLKNTLMETSTAVIDAQVQLDKWSNGFKFGAGGMAAGAREMAFVREEAQRLGLELAGASTQYMKLVAASRGTAMEGEKTRNVFTAVSEAATVMGMSGEQSERAFMAITQMMSKGKVQAEELRGQLGEHLPGAFAIAARSMGVTEAELNKLMETGQIMSADFLPKFGAQLRKELAGSVEDASKSMQASLNRAETAWLMFKQNVAQSGVSSFISQIINAASSDLAAMSTAMESARLAGKGFAGQMNDVAGLVIARSSIGAIEVAAESLNWTINALTGNVLGLSENIDLMPNSLKSAAQQSDALGQRLMDAEARLATLQERFKTSPDSPYFLVEIAQAKLLIEQLKRANQEKAQLIGENYGTESKREESRKGDIRLQDDRLAAYKSLMATLATPQEKFNTELAKQKELLGNLFTADVEARLRAHYIKPVREAAEQTDTLTAARKRELEVVELRNKTVGEAAKAEADYQAAFDARNFDAAWDADQKHLAAVEERIKAGRTALEQLQFENSLLAMNTTEREVATAMRELERQGVVRGTEAWDAYADAIKSAVVDREAAKQATDFWQSIETTAKGVWTDVANGGVSAFERIGKTLKASVLDVLWQMTGRQWLVSVGTSLGIPGAAMAGQQSAGAFSPLQGMGGLDALYKSVTKGVSASVTAGFESLVTNGVGEKLGLSYYNGTGYSTTGLGAQLGQYAGMAGNAMAGYGLQKAISGGYKTGESGLVDVATVVASAVMGPLSGVVGGVFNRAFGRKFTGGGVEGEFGGAAGFAGNSYADYKGGWFRSDKTVRSELDPALAAGLAEGYELLETSVGDMSKALGLSAKGLETYTRKIRFSTNGLSQDQVAQKLQEEFAALGDEMAQLVLGTYAYTRAGESSTEALTRLSTSLTGINATFGVLGRTLYSADLAGADMASHLADAFGGLSAAASASQAYFATYYSDAERAATGTRLLADRFAELGLELPTSHAQLRALIGGLDVTTEAGRNTYAQLLLLAPEFDATAKLIDAVAKANAEKLVKSYTGTGGVLPALDSVRLGASLLATGMGTTSAATGDLARRFGSTTTIQTDLAAATSVLSARYGLVLDSNGKLVGGLTDTQVKIIALATGLSAAQVQAAALRGDAATLASGLMNTSAAAGGLAGWLGQTEKTAGSLSGTLGGTNHWFWMVGKEAGNLSGWLGQTEKTAGNLSGTLGGTNHWFWMVGKEAGNLSGWLGQTEKTAGNLSGTLGGTNHWLWMVGKESESTSGKLGSANHWLWMVGKESESTSGKLDSANHWFWMVGKEAGNLSDVLPTTNHWLWTVGTMSGTLASATEALAAKYGIGEINATDLARATGAFGTSADNTKKAADFAALQLAGMATQIAGVDAKAAGFSGNVSTINTVLGDASSGVIYFGDRITTLRKELDPTQQAVSDLHGEIFTLQEKSKNAIIDIDGLSGALKDVDTSTFVQTVTAVFTTIGERIKGVLGQIAEEREAVRQAAIQILSPATLNPAQIRAEIAKQLVGMPSNAGVALAQGWLVNANAAVALAQGQVEASRERQAGFMSAAEVAQDTISNTLEPYKALVQGHLTDLSDNRPTPERDRLIGVARSEIARMDSEIAAQRTLIAQNQTQAALASVGVALAEATAEGLRSKQVEAADAAKAATLAYAAALQKYSLDASKAVTNLGRLREETVKWYEAQQALAELMTTTAGSLRQTVADYRYNQLDPAAQARQLQERYNVAYTMALSTTGETLAGYGEQMNSLINPLLEKAKEAGMDGTQYGNLVNTTLARAEAVAKRLDDYAPKDYQAESLSLLGQIDATLAGLEDGAKTADQLIKEAIDAGTAETKKGLQDVVAAVTGTSSNAALVQSLYRSVLGREADIGGLNDYTTQLDRGWATVDSIRAAMLGSQEYANLRALRGYATGGSYPGGLALVGEEGPELINFANPGQVYTAQQTAGMLSPADLAELLSEIRALRAESRQTGVQITANTGKVARLLDRFEGEGMPVRNADNTALATETV